MSSGRSGALTPLWQAFDEARFGPERTLNLRAALPTAADAKARAEAWLRERQVARADEVLVITGRGRNSEGGVSPVRAAVAALLPSLRRRGIIVEWQEHTSGSFRVRLAPLSALFEAPKRKREPAATANVASHAAAPPSLAALEEDTYLLLHQLALTSLHMLGVRAPDAFVESEMLSKFATLSRGIPQTEDRDARLRSAIMRAIDEIESS